jgi:hypothetical protein
VNNIPEDDVEMPLKERGPISEHNPLHKKYSRTMLMNPAKVIYPRSYPIYSSSELHLLQQTEIRQIISWVMCRWYWGTWLLTAFTPSSNLYSFIHPWLYSPLLSPGPLISFLIYTQSVGFLGQVINPSQGRYLPTGQHKRRINAETSMLWVGFEPTIPTFGRAKTVQALDPAATVTAK